VPQVCLAAPDFGAGDRRWRVPLQKFSKVSLLLNLLYEFTVEPTFENFCQAQLEIVDAELLGQNNQRSVW